MGGGTLEPPILIWGKIVPPQILNISVLHSFSISSCYFLPDCAIAFLPNMTLILVEFCRRDTNKLFFFWPMLEHLYPVLQRNLRWAKCFIFNCNNKSWMLFKCTLESVLNVSISRNILQRNAAIHLIGCHCLKVPKWNKPQNDKNL